MPALEQQTTQIENTQAGSQQTAASQNLMSEYMSSLPSMAKKIETTNLTDIDTKHDLALTFENIYNAAGGGNAGTTAEETYKNALNDRLKADGSVNHVENVHSSVLMGLKQNGYAIEDNTSRSSGVITPERADAQYKAEKAAVANDAVEQKKYSMDAPSNTTDTNRGTEASIPRDSEFSFTDPKTEQAYISAAGDAAKSLSNPALSNADKAQGVIDAMNKVGVHDNLDVANFQYELGQKLGPDVKFGGRPSVSVFKFSGSLTIDTGSGEPVAVPYKLVDGKLVSGAK